MVFVVPFDGSDLSEAALVRAAELGVPLGKRIVAVSVLRAGAPADAVAVSGDGDVSTLAAQLHERVHALAPAADFLHTTVDQYAPTGAIARALRRVAREQGASMVFVGSENAGRIATTLSSVGSGVAADNGFDVVVVRNPRRERVDSLRAASEERVRECYEQQ